MLDSSSSHSNQDDSIQRNQLTQNWWKFPLKIQLKKSHSQKKLKHLLRLHSRPVQPSSTTPIASIKSTFPAHRKPPPHKARETDPGWRKTNIFLKLPLCTLDLGQLAPPERAWKEIVQDSRQQKKKLLPTKQTLEVQPSWKSALGTMLADDDPNPNFTDLNVGPFYPVNFADLSARSTVLSSRLWMSLERLRRKTLFAQTHK